MAACHRHQFFLVMNHFDRVHFLNFVKGLESDFKLSFLKLTLIGPFDLFIAGDVFRFGRMTLTMTVQMSMDEKEREKEQKKAAEEEEKRRKQDEDEAAREEEEKREQYEETAREEKAGTPSAETSSDVD